MAVAKRDLPETMVSPETGETLRRGERPFLVTYKGTSKTVELPGYYPENGDEGIHVGDDMAVTDAAIRALKEEVEGIPSPATIRRVRKKLKLSQLEAGAFSKLARMPSTSTREAWSSRAAQPANCCGSSITIPN